MPKRFLLIIIGSFLVNLQSVTAQHEADNWIYGWGSWVNFASGEPVRQLSYTALSAEYGSTSLSDSMGNLLFYSDGVDLINRNHQIMPNSIGLMGASMATNPCVAFPMPGDDDKFYLFTVGGKYGYPDLFRAGAEYSIIDMELDGGNGDIIPGKLNVPLIAADSVFETVQAISHGSRDAYWVIMRNHRSPNKMLSFLVDQSGVNQTPVVSICNLYFEYGGSQGEIVKASADGKYLLYADRHGTVGNPGLAELYSFNNITGVLTPIFVFNTNCMLNTGIEFSANSERLYMSQSEYIPSLGEYKRWICQYDMTKINNITSFENDTYIFVQDTCMFPYGNLLLANNGKIYFAHNETEGVGHGVDSYLSEINNPSILGVGCNIELQVVEGVFTFEGLPTFVSSFMTEFDWTGACVGNAITFNSRFYPNPVSYLWNFDDPGSGSSNTSLDADPEHIFIAPGAYNVSVTVVFPNGTQQTSSRIINIFELPVFELGDTLRICQGSTEVVTPGSGYISYLWNTGSTSPSITVSAPGLYWVTVRNQGDCEFTDSLWVINKPGIVIIDDLLTISPTTCGGATGAITGIDFNGQPPYLITWTELISGNPQGNTRDIFNLGVGIYQISVIDANGCSIPQANYEIKDVGDILIDTVTNISSMCNQNTGEINVIAVSGLGARIQYFIKNNSDTISKWHNGVFSGLAPGVYYAWASDSSGCTCVYGYPVIISSPNGPVITNQVMLPATAGQADGSIILTATSSSSDTLYYSVNGVTLINNGYFDDLQAGDYLCTIMDENGCTTSVLITITTLDINYLQAIAHDDAVCMGQTARTPLEVSNFSNIQSFETTLTYDNSVLECTGYANLHPDFMVGSFVPINSPSSGEITLTWISNNPVTLPVNSQLCELLFQPVTPGNSVIRWDVAPGVNHFYDNNGFEIQVDYTMGQVEVNNPPSVSLTDNRVCEFADFIYIPAVSGGTGVVEFIWQNPSGELLTGKELRLYSITSEDHGQYILRVNDSLNCAATSVMVLDVIPTPQANFPSINDTIWYDSQTYLLEASSGYASYEWNTGDTTYYIEVTEEGEYSVIIKTMEGCQATDTVMMVNVFIPIQVPNAFTPNSDAMNDTFRPVVNKELVRMYHLVVYNRWGQRIFETTDVSQGWDGKNAMPGVFSWVIEYQNSLGKEFQMKGITTLIK